VDVVLVFFVAVVEELFGLLFVYREVLERLREPLLLIKVFRHNDLEVVSEVFYDAEETFAVVEEVIDLVVVFFGLIFHLLVHPHLRNELLGALIREVLFDLNSVFLFLLEFFLGLHRQQHLRPPQIPCLVDLVAVLVVVKVQKLRLYLPESEHCDYRVYDLLCGLQEDLRPDVLLPEVLRVGDVPLVLVIQLLDLIDQLVFPFEEDDKHCHGFEVVGGELGVLEGDVVHVFVLELELGLLDLAQGSQRAHHLHVALIMESAHQGLELVLEVHVSEVVELDIAAFSLALLEVVAARDGDDILVLDDDDAEFWFVELCVELVDVSGEEGGSSEFLGLGVEGKDPLSDDEGRDLVLLDHEADVLDAFLVEEGRPLVVLEHVGVVGVGGEVLVLDLLDDLPEHLPVGLQLLPLLLNELLREPPPPPSRPDRLPHQPPLIHIQLVPLQVQRLDEVPEVVVEEVRSVDPRVEVLALEPPQHPLADPRLHAVHVRDVPRDLALAVDIRLVMHQSEGIHPLRQPEPDAALWLLPRRLPLVGRLARGENPMELLPELDLLLDVTILLLQPRELTCSIVVGEESVLRLLSLLVLWEPTIPFVRVLLAPTLLAQFLLGPHFLDHP